MFKETDYRWCKNCKEVTFLDNTVIAYVDSEKSFVPTHEKCGEKVFALYKGDERIP